MSDRANVKIEPCNVIWGDDVAQVSSITTVADDNDSLDGKYFYIYNALNATKYHVWFNTSGGSATDPDPGGSTELEVAITTDDTAGAVATALASALDGLAGFGAAAASNVVTVTNAAVGYANAPHDVNSGFSFEVTTEGDAETDVGYIEGDIEIDPSEDLYAITAHQEGTDILGHIRTGLQTTVGMTFKETTVTQLSRILRQALSTHSPTGANATEVVGLGQDKKFTQTFTQAKKLRLHPVVLSSTDLSRDWTFWKAYPDYESLAHSGENPLMVPVSFFLYPDTTKNEKVRFGCYGDGSQTLT